MKSVKLSLELLELRDLLNIGTVHLTPGWATFGQAVPEGLAPQALRLLNGQTPVPTQTDVKVRWGDTAQSIRFAIVTAYIEEAGYYTVEAAAPPAPDPFEAELPSNFNVNFVIGGVNYVAANPTPTSDLWLNGPLVREFRQEVIPEATGLPPHAFLRVLYDVTIYNPNAPYAPGVRISVTVENVLNHMVAAPLPYTVTVCDGVCEEPNILFHRPDVTHGRGTRWVQRFDFFGLTESQVRTDIESLYRANALPRYAANVRNLDQPKAYNDILGHGSLHWFMPDHAGRAEIAPYPDWAAEYLVDETYTEKSYVLDHGDLAGSWPVHIRDDVSGKLLSINARPNFWYNDEAEPQNKPVGADWHLALSPSGVTTTLAADLQPTQLAPLAVTDHSGFPEVGLDEDGQPKGRAFYIRIDNEYLYVERTDGNDEQTLWKVYRGLYGSTPAAHAAGAQVQWWYDLTPDNDHQPSLAYIPYLLTGRRYYADELAFWANYVLLATNGDSRLHYGYLFANETRGIAWGLRNLTDAAAYLPENIAYFEDPEPTKLYLIDKVYNNLAWFDGFAQDPGNPHPVLGVAWHRLDDNHVPEGTPDPPPFHWNILWQHNYVAWAIDHGNKQGFTGGLDWRNQLGPFQVNYLRDTRLVPGYELQCERKTRDCVVRDGAAPYRLRLGEYLSHQPPIIDWVDDRIETFEGESDLTMAQYGADARLVAVLGLENGWDPGALGYNFVDTKILEATTDNKYPRPGWAVARPQ